MTDTKLSSMEQMLLNEALKKNTTITELDFSSEKKEENDMTFLMTDLSCLQRMILMMKEQKHSVKC